MRDRLQDLTRNVGVFLPNHLLESLDEEEGSLADDNNNIWDWDGNNDK